MSTTPTLVETPITCKLCGKVFPIPRGVILTENPDQRAAQFVKRLAVHLKERHSGAQMTAALAGAEYTGMLTLMYFDLSGNIETQRDFLRWKIRQQTQRAYVTDRRIIERTLALMADRMTKEEIDHTMKTPGELGFEIVKTMCEMRDVLTEAGRYATPDPSQGTPLVASKTIEA